MKKLGLLAIAFIVFSTGAGTLLYVKAINDPPPGAQHTPTIDVNTASAELVAGTP